MSAALAVAYGLLMLLLAGRHRERLAVASRRWLVTALAAALAGAVIYALPDDIGFEDPLTQPALAIMAVNLMLVLFGAQTLRYLQYRGATLWTVAGLIWWGAQVATSLLEDELIIGQEGWMSSIYDPVVLPGVLAIGGWVVIGICLLAAGFYAFFKARLPEIANRSLFWAFMTPLVLMGAVLGTSGASGMSEAGWVLQFAGLLGATYSVLVYRVFDIRRALRHATATGILTFITGLVFFGVLVAGHQIDLDTDTVYLALAGVALAAAVIYIPVRTMAQAFVNRLFGTSAEGVPQLLRQYSEDITGVVELDALVDVTMPTLSQVLRVRRGGLILVTEEEHNNLYIEPVLHGLGEIPDIKGRIAHDSPIYKQLVQSRSPLLQYDLDFGRAYAGATLDERRFFQNMRMSAYAPIVVQGRLIGVLCCGAKTSDDPFTNHDLELLMTIANQVGVALRNARLVADLRRREAEQADLNARISATKEQLERLDSVKTDFITIASHELRTPLAQIRGYTDIMDAINEQGALDQEQVGSLMGNLRKAADRLENLIGAMLDVSQLDVDAMDLRFAQTSIENVMRMAIEPLTESIQSRKLMLSARGLRNLPPIQADMQRLVQAFRNVVLNAIKYTPDGGRIDISGRMQDDELVVMIQDSGIGIDPANHELIFGKFFRAHDPSLHSTGATKFMGAGPGLGLTIARGVIEGHGGRIWVESAGYDAENFPGSTFYIALPLTPPADGKRVLAIEPGKLAHENRPTASDDGDSEIEADASPTLTRPPSRSKA